MNLNVKESLRESSGLKKGLNYQMIVLRMG